MAAGRLSGLHDRVLHIISELEDVKARAHQRKGMSWRTLQLEREHGLDEAPCHETIGHKLGVSSRYAGELCQILCREGLLAKTDRGRYTLTPRGTAAIARELTKRGYVPRGKTRTLIEFFSH